MDVGIIANAKCDQSLHTPHSNPTPNFTGKPKKSDNSGFASGFPSGFSSNLSPGLPGLPQPNTGQIPAKYRPNTGHGTITAQTIVQKATESM